MYLIVDIGNTRIKWCTLDQGVLTPFIAIRNIGSWSATLRTSWSEIDRPQSVLVSCVAAPAILSELISITKTLWNIDPILVRPRQLTLGMNIAYQDTTSLGVDRWLAMLAARQRKLHPALIVDCGTATTIDVLNASGNHLGGLIAPGLRLLWNTIFTNTQILPPPFSESFNLLGQNTAECVASGALQATVGLIERVRTQHNIQEMRPHIVLTGGDAITISPQLTYTHSIIDELVLEGLALLAN